ncbi:MAG: phosphoglucomutase/phosphomannomutase family protein [Elusimicrobiota bacterium]
MIKFGTSGWRAVIGEEFNIDNVRVVVSAIANYVIKNHKSDKRVADKKSIPQVVIGYDTRFLSDKFARTAAEVLAGNNIKALFCVRDVPTPVVGYEIVRRKIDGGINFTASHNPSDYNGIKFSPSWGGPALPEVTKEIENSCQKILSKRNGNGVKSMSWDEGLRERLIEEIDPRSVFLKRIEKFVDYDTIKKAKLRVGADFLYGTGRGYLDTALQDAGCKVHTLHFWRDVLFGGKTPEPSEENLAELYELMKTEKCVIGLSVDGDADRFGILDTDGTYIVPNQVLAVLLYFLKETRKWDGVVARTVMTSHFVDAVANKYGIPVRETPVGFKFIGEVMESEPMIIGGEESGGLTIKGHIPEKDGVLACLLMAELRAWAKKPITAVINELYKKVGYFYTDRINFRLDSERVAKLSAKLKAAPPKEVLGIKVAKLNTMDGFKFILTDGSWFGLRLSGTEPVVRYYIETNSAVKLKKLHVLGEHLVNCHW